MWITKMFDSRCRVDNKHVASSQQQVITELAHTREQKYHTLSTQVR